MSIDWTQRRAAFRQLHQQGCFVIGNAWDKGSAVRLARLGFPALASTSSGAAWTQGLDDGDLSRDQVLAHLRELCAATDLPVNADYEAGFADDPATVGANVALAVQTGVAGLSIEDRTGVTLYDLELARERMAAARAAIDASGQDVLLVGRCEGYLIGRKDLKATLERLSAYAEAGADCLYAPGMTDLDEIAETVRALAPKPVNVLIAGTGLRVQDLAERGVRRISVGGAFAAIAYHAAERAARQLLEVGALPARS